MRKLNIFTVLIVFLFTQYCFSQNNDEQIDDEYKESRFQGAEEISNTSNPEIFIISSYQYRKDLIVLNTPAFIIVDYIKNKLTIKVNNKITDYELLQDDNSAYWSEMADYEMVKGNLVLENKKFRFAVEKGSAKTITFQILIDQQSGGFVTKTYYAQLKKILIVRFLS